MRTTGAGRWLAVWIALVGGVAGCGITCQLPEEVPVRGPAGVKPQVRSVLASFATWLGTDEVCVTRIEVHAEDHGREFNEIAGVGASLNRGSGRIQVWDPADPAFDRFLLHELCHAIDHVYGHHQDHPGIWDYTPRSFEEGLIEPGSERSHAEAFATTCEAGPAMLTRARAALIACDRAANLAQIEYVLDEVFQGSWDPDAYPGGLEPETWRTADGYRATCDLFTGTRPPGSTVGSGPAGRR